MTARNHDAQRLRWPLLAGAIAGLLAVIAGAFGDHGLRGQVDSYLLDVFRTAVSYQMYHALALVLVALLAGQGWPRKRLLWAAGFYLAGILMFSGSLYLLVLSGQHWLGPVTPMGGLCFMAGWLMLVAAACGRQSAPAQG